MNRYGIIFMSLSVPAGKQKVPPVGGKAKGPADRRDLLLSHTVNPHNAVRAQNAYLNL